MLYHQLLNFRYQKPDLQTQHKMGIYQLLIMNGKDFMKTLKKLNDTVYIENQDKLNR